MSLWLGSRVPEWTLARLIMSSEEELRDVPELAVCGVCSGRYWAHRFGCRVGIEEVARRLLASESLYRRLGIDETPETRCLETAKAYNGAGADHWRRVADIITELRAQNDH